MSVPVRKTKHGRSASGKNLPPTRPPAEQAQPEKSRGHDKKKALPPEATSNPRAKRKGSSSGAPVASTVTAISSSGDLKEVFISRLMKDANATEEDACELFEGGIREPEEAVEVLELPYEQQLDYLSVHPAILGMKLPADTRVKTFLEYSTAFRKAGIPLNLKTFPVYVCKDWSDTSRLGKGGFSSVSQVKATKPGHSEEVEMAFKPAGASVGSSGLHAGIPASNAQLECRNLLTSLLAEKLIPDAKDNVIPRSRLGIVGNRPGVMMEVARGTELNPALRRGTLNPATAASRRLAFGKERIEKNPDAKSNFLRQNRLLALTQLEGGRWSVDAAVDSLPEGLDLDHPELKRKLTWLALIDHLCNQVDRHASNILIVPIYNDKQQVVSYEVVGIDNDQTFGKKLNDAWERREILISDRGRALLLPEVVDQEMFDAIQNLTHKDCRQLARGLLADKREIKAFVRRLDDLKAHLDDLEADGKVITKDGWKKVELTNPETSYAAREGQKSSRAALLDDNALTELMLNYPALDGIGQPGKDRASTRSDLEGRASDSDLNDQADRNVDFDELMTAFDAIGQSKQYDDFVSGLKHLKRKTPVPDDKPGIRLQKAAHDALGRLGSRRKLFKDSREALKRLIDQDADKSMLEKAEAEVRHAGALWVSEIYQSANLRFEHELRSGMHQPKRKRLPEPPAPVAQMGSPLPQPSGAPQPAKQKAASFNSTHPLANWLNAQWPDGVDYYKLSSAQLQEICSRPELGALSTALIATKTRAATAANEKLWNALIRAGGINVGGQADLAKALLDAIAAGFETLSLVAAES